MAWFDCIFGNKDSIDILADVKKESCSTKVVKPKKYCTHELYNIAKKFDESKMYISNKGNIFRFDSDLSIDGYISVSIFEVVTKKRHFPLLSNSHNTIPTTTYLNHAPEEFADEILSCRIATIDELRKIYQSCDWDDQTALIAMIRNAIDVTYVDHDKNFQEFRDGDGYIYHYIKFLNFIIVSKMKKVIDYHTTESMLEIDIINRTVKEVQSDFDVCVQNAFDRIAHECLMGNVEPTATNFHYISHQEYIEKYGTIVDEYNIKVIKDKHDNYKAFVDEVLLYRNMLNSVLMANKLETVIELNTPEKFIMFVGMKGAYNNIARYDFAHHVEIDDEFKLFLIKHLEEKK